MTEEELRARQQIKKIQQHKAWLKWYRSPKGEAYRAKQKERRSQEDDTVSQSPEQ